MFPEYKAIERFELIETQIPTNSTSTRFNFADQPQLRTDQNQDVVIQGLAVYNVVDVPLSPNNVALISGANMAQTYLTLYIDGEESVYRIPLTHLHQINNFASPFNSGPNDPGGVTAFRNVMVDFTKSYFFTPAAYGGGVFATFSILLGVVYKKLPPGTMGVIKANEYNGYCNLQISR